MVGLPVLCLTIDPPQTGNLACQIQIILYNNMVSIPIVLCSTMTKFNQPFNHSKFVDQTNSFFDSNPFFDSNSYEPPYEPLTINLSSGNQLHPYIALTTSNCLCSACLFFQRWRKILISFLWCGTIFPLLWLVNIVIASCCFWRLRMSVDAPYHTHHRQRAAAFIGYSLVAMLIWAMFAAGIVFAAKGAVSCDSCGPSHRSQKPRI